MMRAIMAIAVTAIIIAVAGSGAAQQATIPAGESPFAAAVQRWVDAFNKKDAAAVAALYTNDAIRVVPAGIHRGRDAIQKNLEAAVNAGMHGLSVRHVVHRVEGNNGWSVAEYDARIRGQDGADVPVKGFASAIWVRDGDAWKIQMHMTNVAPPTRQ
jgi:uncharacterized protein (TIGR02246 family)